MARGYKTGQGRFVDDFIYQPPWELINQALAKEQGEYDYQLASANVLGQVDFKYIEDPVEKAAAMAIQEEYANKANDLANKFKNSGNDWRKNIQELNKTRRALESDYKTGRINNLQKSAEAFEKAMAQVEGLTDAERKNLGKDYLMNNWKSKNPNGSADGIFNADHIFDKQDLTQEFLTLQKDFFPADKLGTAYARADDGGYLHEGTDMKEIRDNAEKAYQDWISTGKHDAYLRQSQDMGIGMYFDPETGERLSFNDPRNTLANEAKLVKHSNFKNTTATKNISSDQTWLALWTAEQNAINAKVAKEAASSSVDVSNYYNFTTAGADVTRQYNQDLFNYIKNINPKATPTNYTKYVEKYRENPTLYPKAMEGIKELDNRYNAERRAGTDYFKKTYNFPPELEKQIRQIYETEGIEATLALQPGHLFLGPGKDRIEKVVGKNGKESTKTFPTQIMVAGNNVKPRTIQDMIGTKIYGIKGIKDGSKIVKINPIPKQTYFMPAASADGKSGSRMTVQIVTDDNDADFNGELVIPGDPHNLGI